MDQIRVSPGEAQARLRQASEEAAHQRRLQEKERPSLAPTALGRDFADEVGVPLQAALQALHEGSLKRLAVVESALERAQRDVEGAQQQDASNSGETGGIQV